MIKKNRIKSLLFILFVLFTFNVNAQNKYPKFGIGVNSEIFSLSLNSDIEQYSTDVFLSYSLTPKIQILMASRSNKLMNIKIKQYENNIAGLLGFGYLFQKDSMSNFSTLVQVAYGNTFNKSVSYNEHIIDIGTNFYFFRIFYLGTGLKFFHIEETNFTNLPNCNINWYWRLGFQLRFWKK